MGAGASRTRRLERCKRIANLIRQWPSLSCGCRLKLQSCGCLDVCVCPVELDLCSCAEDDDTKSIAAFLLAADPENYEEPNVDPRPTRAVSHGLRILVMQDRVARGFTPKNARDLDPNRIKGAVVAGRGRNGRLLPGEVSFDLEEGEWWDDYLEYVIDQRVLEDDLRKHPLFYVRDKPVDFYDLPAKLQEEKIREEEDMLRRKFAKRRGTLSHIRTLLKRVGMNDEAWEKDLARLESRALKEREFVTPR